MIHSRSPALLSDLRNLLDRFAHINWALADQAIVSGASFATTVLIARFLGLEEFGRFTLAWLAIFFAQNLQTALILTPLNNIGAKQRAGERAGYFGSIAVHQGLFAIATSALVYLCFSLSGLFAPELKLETLAVPLALLIFFGQIADCLRPYFFVLNKGNITTGLSAVRYGLQLSLLLALLSWGGSAQPLQAIVYAMAAAAFMASLAGYFCIGPLTFDASSLASATRRNWRLSRWLLPNSIALWARENLIFTATATFVGVAEVGALRAAQQIVYVVNVILFGFGNIVPIRASSAFDSGGFQGLVDFIGRFVMRYNALIVAMLIPVMLAGDLLLAIIYGQAYTQYGYLVRAFVFIVMIQLARMTVSTILRAMETTAYEFYASCTALAFVALASYPLVRELGLPGAMLGLFLFESILLLVASLGIRKQAPVPQTALSRA